MDEVDLYVEELNSKDAAARLEAVQVLAASGDERAIEPLIGRIKDRKHEVRDAAIAALGRFPADRVIQVLVELLGAKETSVQVHASGALLRIGTRAVPALLRALDEPATRAFAVTLLGELRVREAVEPLIRLLHSGERPADLCMALGKIGDTRAVEPILPVLDDPDDTVKIYAADALGELRDRRAVVPLLPLLRHPSWQVRCRVAGALGEIGDPSVAGILQDLLASEDETSDPLRSVRTRTGKALQQLGGVSPG